MTSSLIIFVVALVGLLTLFWLSERRKKDKALAPYERFLAKFDPRVRKTTFRCVRKVIVMRDSSVRAIQKWSIAFAHFFLEVVHFISARFNKSLVRMKYKTRNKAQEIKTQEPSEFLRQVREERELG